MKLCVFSDIHGNLLFFNAFLKHCEGIGIDRMIFLGDSVSYYPDGNAVIGILRERNITCIEGNHDSMARGEYPIPEKHEPVYQLRRTMETISPENMAYLRSWPDHLRETIDGVRILFVHGCPLNFLKGYAYEDSEFAAYDDPETDIVFMGHTHRAWIRRNPHTLLVNVGSVGLPRDKGRFPSYALFDTETREVTIRRFEADPTPILQDPGTIHPDVLNVFNRE